MKSYFEQMRRAHDLMTRMRAYAASIGCRLGEGAAHDMIECDAKQSELLRRWWNENAEQE